MDGKRIAALAAGFALSSVLVIAGCSSQPVQTAGVDGTEQSGQDSPLVTVVTPDTDVVYTLYFGLVDKDTKTERLTMAEAKEILKPIFVEHDAGYTIYDAFGGYLTEDRGVVENSTVVIECHGEEQAIKAIIDDAKAALNIESVYVQAAVVGYGINGGEVGGVG